MIQKVSIAIKRNFEGMKFGPSGPSNDRETILKSMEKIFEKFNQSDKDRFSGNFY